MYSSLTVDFNTVKGGLILCLEFMIFFWIVNPENSQHLSVRHLSCFMEYQGKWWQWVTWCWVEGAWVSRKCCTTVLNWSAMVSGWAFASEASSSLNCFLSTTEIPCHPYHWAQLRFWNVQGTHHKQMIRRQTMTNWHSQWRRESFSQRTTRWRVCPQWWVDPLTAWEKWMVYSMSMICAVLWLVLYGFKNIYISSLCINFSNFSVALLFSSAS